MTKTPNLDRLSAEGVQVLSWPEFQRMFRWKQGEHVSLIGSTGSGKTVLAHRLLPMREWVCVLATKPRDKEMSSLMREGYTKLTAWPPRNGEVNRVVLWPNIDKRSYLRDQRAAFLDALDSMYEAHGWTVYADELGYMISELKLEGPFRMLWQQGRSIGLTLVASMQRPRHVPLLAYSQASHIFFWLANDDYDLKRIGGIGSLNSRKIQHIVSHLPGPPNAGFSKQECSAFLYINTRSGKMCVSRVEL